MTAAIAKYAANKMLSKEMQKYKDKNLNEKDEYDPYYVMIPHPKKKGKFKKVKKQIPDYIPEADAIRLAKCRKRAYRLDYCLFNLGPLRFGWSSVIGLIPVAGDSLDFLLAVRHAFSMRKTTRGRLPILLYIYMSFNIAWDLVVGLIPIVGDLADAAVKCNSKNLRIFENHLDNLYRPQALKQQDAKTNEELVAQSLPRLRPASVYVDLSDEEDFNKTTFEDAHDDVRPPNRAYSPTRTRIPDEEMGLPRRERGANVQQPLRNGHGTRGSRR